MKTWIRAKRLISDGFVMENTGVLAEDGVILSILPTPPANAQVLDLQEATLVSVSLSKKYFGVEFESELVFNISSSKKQ